MLPRPARAAAIPVRPALNTFAMMVSCLLRSGFEAVSIASCDID
jgi:hypothetical protein